MFSSFAFFKRTLSHSRPVLYVQAGECSALMLLRYHGNAVFCNCIDGFTLIVADQSMTVNCRDRLPPIQGLSLRRHILRDSDGLP